MLTTKKSEQFFVQWCDIGGPNKTLDFAATFYNHAMAQGRQVTMNDRKHLKLLPSSHIVYHRNQGAASCPTSIRLNTRHLGASRPPSGSRRKAWTRSAMASTLRRMPTSTKMAPQSSRRSSTLSRRTGICECIIFTCIRCRHLCSASLTLGPQLKGR